MKKENRTTIFFISLIFFFLIIILYIRVISYLQKGKNKKEKNYCLFPFPTTYFDCFWRHLEMISSLNQKRRTANLADQLWRWEAEARHLVILFFFS